MTKNRKAVAVFMQGVLAVLVFSAVFAGSASASPVWKFNGTKLSGSETITGDAILSSINVPGLSNICKKMNYTMTISNGAGTGKGELTAFSFTTCITNSEKCTIKSIGAEKLPWPVHLTAVSGSNYVVVEGIKIAILYAGAECVLNETLVTVTGTAGGLYENATETLTFNASSFSATSTALKALGAAAEWNGVFTTEATGSHSGQALTIG